MNQNTTRELNNALGLLADAGLRFTVVDRCPIEACPTCATATPRPLPAAA